uniref:(northern house mosquito) hypothetical protein n=1 Tax=Culex pipiens TaxID=7175 RepID=A0A8D8FG62_CULPI
MPPIRSSRSVLQESILDSIVLNFSSMIVAELENIPWILDHRSAKSVTSPISLPWLRSLRDLFKVLPSKLISEFTEVERVIIEWLEFISVSDHYSSCQSGHSEKVTRKQKRSSSNVV